MADNVTVPLSHRFFWPPEYQGGKIHNDWRVITGVIEIPAEIQAYDLTAFERAFPKRLWPPCWKDGFLRWAREFVWKAEGRVLHYRIIDQPITDWDMMTDAQKSQIPMRRSPGFGDGNDRRRVEHKKIPDPNDEESAYGVFVEMRPVVSKDFKPSHHTVMSQGE